MDEKARMIDLRLARVVIREGSERQYIYLVERDGPRGFPIVIGSNEAWEIHRVVSGHPVERPLTHQLAASIIESLGARVDRCDIVDIRDRTYFAHLVLERDGGPKEVIDARPSDAIALALRTGSPIRVAEHVLEQVRTDNAEPDQLPEDDEEPEEEPGEGEV